MTDFPASHRDLVLCRNTIDETFWKDQALRLAAPT
jgi:hypothetical protein